MEIKLQPSWHHLLLAEVEKDLKTSQEQGLFQFDVKHRQLQFGPNRVASRPAKSPLIRFLAQFNQPLIYILLAAGLFTLILQEWSDSSFIFGVVLINAVVGFLQEAKAESAIAALKSMVLTNATVIRDGRKDTIVSEDLVPGDLVLLQSGDKVPADLRLFWTKDLQIDESMLTGESVPVHKTADVLPEDLVLADRRNMAFAGNLVTYGQARGWVTAIGEQTETGKIAHLISTAADLSTPLTRKIEHFSKILLYAILALAVLVVVAGLLRHEPLLQ
ncbi:MAG: cation-transporting P-type ATPase, partial [Desulfobacteraceae bacterium]